MAALRASTPHSGSDSSPTVALGLNTSSAPFSPNACTHNAHKCVCSIDDRLEEAHDYG